MTRRYFAAYGPATAQDFGHWFWLKPAMAREVLAALGDELVEVTVEGRPAWVPTADAAPDAPADPAPPRLLPQYDAYTLSAGPRERAVPPAAKARAATYKRGRYEGATALPLLLIDGAVAGIWARQPHGKRIEIRVEPLAPLTPAPQDHLAAEVAWLGAFLGLDAKLTVGALV